MPPVIPLAECDARQVWRRTGWSIIGVNLDAEPPERMEFLDEIPGGFPYSLRRKRRCATEYGVEAMPSSYVIGRDGELLGHSPGFKVKKQDEYEAVLVEALGESQQ